MRIINHLACVHTVQLAYVSAINGQSGHPASICLLFSYTVCDDLKYRGQAESITSISIFKYYIPLM